MKKFIPFSLPGENFPHYGAMCVFQTHNDIFFIGFVPDSLSQIFVYAFDRFEQKTSVKNFQYIYNEDGGMIECRLQPLNIKK